MPVSDQSVHGADTPITESLIAYVFVQWYATKHAKQLKKQGVLDIHAGRLYDGKFKITFLAYLETTRMPIEIVNGNDSFWIHIEKYGPSHYCCRISDPPPSKRVTDAYASPTAMREAQAATNAT